MHESLPLGKVKKQKEKISYCQIVRVSNISNKSKSRSTLVGKKNTKIHAKNQLFLVLFSIFKKGHNEKSHGKIEQMIR